MPSMKDVVRHASWFIEWRDLKVKELRAHKEKDALKREYFGESARIAECEDIMNDAVNRLDALEYYADTAAVVQERRRLEHAYDAAEAEIDDMEGRYATVTRMRDHWQQEQGRAYRRMPPWAQAIAFGLFSAWLENERQRGRLTS